MPGGQSAMEPFARTALLLGVFFAPCSHGQGIVTGTTDGSNALQPWLVGLAAVVGFLCVTLIATLINRLFFSQKTDDEAQLRKENNEVGTASNVYDNLAMDAEEGPAFEGTADLKMTHM